MCNTRSALKAFLYLPRMRSNILLLTIIIFLGLQAGAYAQADFTVTSTAPLAISTNNTALAGDIVFTQVGISVAGKLTITYPGPITCDLFTGPIIVTGTGGYDGAALYDSESSQNSDASGHGILVIQVPAGVSGTASIKVSGVRLALASSGLGFLIANIEVTGNAITSPEALVIYSVAGISSLSGIAGEINASTGAVTVSPWVGVTEGFQEAFDLQYPGDTTKVLVRFTLDQPPPAGVTVTFPAHAVASSPGSSSVWETTYSDGYPMDSDVGITSSSEDLSVYYKTDTTSLDPSYYYQETLSVPVTLSVSGPLPLSPVTISYTVSLAPIGPAFDAGGGVISDPVPRFEEALVGPATLFIVTSTPSLPLSPVSKLLKPGGGTNVYEFADNLFNFKVTYNQDPSLPPGIYLVVQPILISQDDLDALVYGTDFEGANLVPYDGTGGFGVLFRVSCEDEDHVPIPCPVPVGIYEVRTAWYPPTGQAIVAPAFLKATVGESDWQDILSEFYEDKIDGMALGRTCCHYSDFVFVDMVGSTSGMGTTLPTIDITSPADGAVYALYQDVLAGYSCSVQECYGTVATGSPIDTLSLGIKPFDVVATVGSDSSIHGAVSYIKSVSYNVGEHNIFL
jgi:hypothetical protein